MPAAESSGGRRGGRLLPVLFWSGVGLAPLAALLLLIGQGSGPLRVAAALAVLAIVLIGLSITLRRDGETLRAEVEDIIVDELDAVRDDVRDDISHAARATHKALADKIVVLHDTVEALRGQVDLLRGQLERAATTPAPRAVASARHPTQPSHHGPGVLRHTETVQVTTRQTMVVDQDSPENGTVYGSRGNGYPNGRGDEYGRGDDFDAGRMASEYGAARSVAEVPAQRRPERLPEPSRHEPSRHEPSRHESTGREAAPRELDSGGSAPREESWTEQLLRERLAQRQAADGEGTGRHDGERRDGERREGGRRRAYDDDEGDRLTGVRTTDRWASVRSDDRGRELRMGERRAAMHASESGTELRIEDRWASVLREEARRRESTRDREPARDDAWREEPRRSAARRERERDDVDLGEPDTDRGWSRADETRRGDGGDYFGDGRSAAHWSETSWEESRRGSADAGWDGVRPERRGVGGSTRAALPAAPSEPASSWSTGWANAGGRDEFASDRTPARSRHASDDDDNGWNGGRGDEPRYRDATRDEVRDRDESRNGGGRSRLVDFEGSDDRWR